MEKSQTIGFFEKLLNAISKDPLLEFEIKYRDRFSNFEDQNFASGISPSIFYQILDILKQKCLDQKGSDGYVALNNGDPIIFANQSLIQGDERFKDFRLTTTTDQTEPVVISKKG